MLFSVIYSADVPANANILDFAPPNVAELWDETEDDDQYEYGYLEGEWEQGHHRKWKRTAAPTATPPSTAGTFPSSA